ncbi:DUF2268 domain-containing putative Zn-dependent protease [Novosphingobium sp. BL-8H]|uniref:DUF2268 domain-containing putative Zn-dependent protease n=1 Tax=Novosphingobium sp. BL-8H TaxID=3127640 RepID=UPI003756ECEF
MGKALAAAVAIGGCLFALPAAARPQASAEIRIGDVDRFYALYDAAGGKPSAEVLQHDYIDAGSDGVRQFVPHRILSGQKLATEVALHPEIYQGARACLKVLPTVKARLETAFAKLAKLDPQAHFPPVTILIGRNNSGGTTGASGVLIGLEVACRSDWPQAEIADRLVHLIAHEYGHIQQPAALDDETLPTTVLRQSLIEGVAELLAELSSGDIGNAHLRDWTRGKQAEIDKRFLAEADSADLSDWLYNGRGTPDHPGDLGYWEGYRIAKAYYDHAKDKRTALATLIRLDSPKAILAESGWTPAPLPAGPTPSAPSAP